MAKKTTVAISRNALPRFAETLRPRASQVVRKTAIVVQSHAKANTPPRVDTGAMLNGYQIEYQGDLRAIVFNTQDYHIVQELGSSRGIAPHPMLIPAGEAARPGFIEAMRQLAAGPGS